MRINFLLQKISSASFDIMITAGISAISILAFRDNWLFILILTTVGALFTMWYTNVIAKRIYKEDILENVAGPLRHVDRYYYHRYRAVA